MDKPLSMSLKDYLIKTMAVRTNTPSATIETIVNYQFEEANKALRSNNSVEISGFGKFVFKKPAALRKMIKLHSEKEMYERLLKDPNNPQERMQSCLNKLNNTIKGIEELKTKLDGTYEDTRGVEK